MTMFDIGTTDEHREIARKRYGHLPDDAREVAAGYICLLEQVDKKYEPYRQIGQGTTYAEARSILNSEPPLTPERIHRLQQEYVADREPFVRGLRKLLSLYPEPIFIRHT